jgi:hypothetical protein
MADMDTTYGGGRATTTTRGLGGAGALFDPQLLGALLAQGLKRKEEDRAFDLRQRQRFEQAQPAAKPALPATYGGGLGAGGARGMSSRMAFPDIAARSMQAPERSSADTFMENRERDARLAQIQAGTGPAPTREVGGPGIIAGRTLDPMAMNAYQRRLYLPQAAQTVQGPAETNIGGELEEFDQQNLRRLARQNAFEKLRAGSGPTRVTGWTPIPGDAPAAGRR